MSEPKPRRLSVWRTLAWRGLVAGGLLLLVIAACLVYLNLVGAPEFLKERFAAKLRAQGVVLQIRKLRLHGYSELSAHGVRLARTDETDALLFADRISVHLDRSALRKLSPRPTSFSLAGARLLWPFPLSNSTPASVKIDELTADVRLSSDDRLEVSRCSGRFLNAELRVSGSITNFSNLRQRLFSKTSRPARPELAARLHRIVSELNRVQFTNSSTIDFTFTGNGDRTNDLKFALAIQAPLATIPWTDAGNVMLAASLSPAATPERAFDASVNLRVGDARGRWGALENAEIKLKLMEIFERSFSDAGFQSTADRVSLPWATNEMVAITGSTKRNKTSDFATVVDLRSERAGAAWGRASKGQVHAEVTHRLTDLSVFDGKWNMQASEVMSSWANSDDLRISGRVERRGSIEEPTLADAKFGWWKYLEPFQSDWRATVTNLVSPKIKIDRAEIAGDWHSPTLAIREVRGDLYGGQFNTQASLDVRSREVLSQSTVDFDVRQISPLLTTNAQRWLRQFAWEKPPHVTTAARVILPVWTNRHPEWQADVLPTLHLAGEFSGTNGAFRTVPVTSAHSHFTLTNFAWWLPDLSVSRPEGTARLAYSGDMRTQEYYWDVDGRIDPKAFRPLLDPPAQKALDYVEFASPPDFKGEIWGRWYDRDLLGFRGRVACTNFVLRGQRFSSLATDLTFTNLLFSFANAEVHQDKREATVPRASFDIKNQTVCVTNVVSTLDPGIVTRVIGPKVNAAISPYHFSAPPRVEVTGCFLTSGAPLADAHFRVTGDEFSYWKFKLPHVSGDLHWLGETLSISNLQAGFYGGTLTGDGFFDFASAKGADFRFRTHATDANLRTLVMDLNSSTNDLEGALDGNLIITSANSENQKSWQGFGDANLRDGFLWNIPIFGLFSPVLNKIAPGLGSVRATAGSATFTIQESVVYTSDLEVRSPAVRLLYDGKVSSQGHVDARMQAEILRDAWAVGRVLSWALWPVTKVFEYRITGTINEPHSEPLYIPKVLTWPFRPLRGLMNIFSSGKAQAPPKQSPSPLKEGPSNNGR